MQVGQPVGRRRLRSALAGWTQVLPPGPADHIAYCEMPDNDCFLDQDTMSVSFVL